MIPSPRSHRRADRDWAVVALLLPALALGACSLRAVAARTLGRALASGGSVWAGDDDPELVGEAMPFALKTIESLLASAPRDRGLLLAASSGFTQYAYAFVQSEADYLEATDLDRATALRARAGRLYRRAVDYGRRGLEAAQPGFAAAVRRDADAALAPVTAADVPLLYWTAAAWGARIALAKDDPELTADLPLVERLMRRVRELDPGFAGGAVFDFYIAWEGGRPAAAGGSPERAREALAAALRFARGRRAAPLVAFAETVAVGTQDRAEFVRRLGEALAVDPAASDADRLATLLAQRRARWLLARADELFIE